MTEGKLSLAQLIAVLDNVPAAVFVSAVDSGRLLYTNALAREFDVAVLRRRSAKILES